MNMYKLRQQLKQMVEKERTAITVEELIDKLQQVPDKTLNVSIPDRVGFRFLRNVQVVRVTDNITQVELS